MSVHLLYHLSRTPEVSACTYLYSLFQAIHGQERYTNSSHFWQWEDVQVSSTADSSSLWRLHRQDLSLKPPTKLNLERAPLGGGLH